MKSNDQEPAPKRTMHRLLINETAFQIVVDTTHAYQRRSLKPATFRQTLETYLDLGVLPDTETISRFQSIRRLSGDISLSIAIEPTYRMAFDRFRNHLAKTIESPTDTRFAIILAYYHLSEKLT